MQPSWQTWIRVKRLPACGATPAKLRGRRARWRYYRSIILEVFETQNIGRHAIYLDLLLVPGMWYFYNRRGILFESINVQEHRVSELS